MTPFPDSRRWFRTPALVMTTTAIAFVAVALSLTLRLRSEIRAQILGREAAALDSMATVQLARADAELAEVGIGSEPEDWFPYLAESWRLRGVIALRLFDATGALRDALPVPVSAQVPSADWQRLHEREPFARLHPQVDPASLTIGTTEQPGTGAPLLEVLVPLRSPDHGLRGVAQYWIDGTAMQREFALLDRNLWLRGGLAALGGAGIALLALAWAFRRLRAAHHELERRSEDLARANLEFSLAAKTSALGAITAHLIHGLKNPLAGLEGYVAGQPDDTRDDAGEERRAAIETTQRIRTMVNEVISILREEQAGGATYRVTLAELLGAAGEKIRPLAAARGVVFTALQDGAGELPGRRANLLLLVLDNLLRNACEASPRGGRVTLSVTCKGRQAIFVIEDEGPGLTPTVRDQLFQPVTSTKPGGGGIGLVISHQLAQHAGGVLTLEKSDAHGCRFRLAAALESSATLTR
jgi:signal transduction histidine kinase